MKLCACAAFAAAKTLSELEDLYRPFRPKRKTRASVAKAKGLALVFEKNSLLYLDPAQGVNLTPEVRTALNIPEDRTLEKLQQEMQAKAQAAQAQ